MYFTTQYGRGTNVGTHGSCVRPRWMENECTRLVERMHGPCVPTFRKAYNLFARSLVNCQPKCEWTHEPCVPTFPSSFHIAHKNTYYLLSFLFHLSTACTIFVEDKLHSAIENKFPLRSFALSLHKIGCTQQLKTSFHCARLYYLYIGYGIWKQAFR